MLSQYHTPAMFILALLTSTVLAGAAELSCLDCHEEQKDQFTPSAHAQAGLTCLDCHGGNGKAADLGAHEAKDFRRPKNKQQIAESCAVCHSDVRRMNPYGLPTDQLERYKTSRHGEALFGRGDQKVATCTDCHGVHTVLKVKSPQSPTYPTRIPQTCGRCHSDAALMADHKLPADVVTNYLSSYHAFMVLQKGDLSAPTCVTCHGNHGAVPPGAREVGQVCGKCHVRQREFFEQSPHAKLAAAGKFMECVSCHGNHAIQRASLDLLAQSCARCHQGQPKPLAVRDTVAGLVKGALNAQASAQARVRAATIQGLATDEQQVLLQEAGTLLTQLEVEQHTLSPDQLSKGSGRAQAVTQQVLKGLEELERREHVKRIVLTVFWSFLVLMAVLFWLRRRVLEQARQ